MKFLDISSLALLTSALSGIDIGDSIIYGRIECYSCMLAEMIGNSSFHF
jgi:hypothetical protein